MPDEKGTNLMPDEEKTDDMDLHDPPKVAGDSSLQRLGSPEPPPMPAADITMTQVLAMLVQQGGDIEVIKEMVALKKELEHDEAKKKFNVALAKAQHEMQPIVANAYNKHTKSNYAALEALNLGITPIVSKHGFGTTFNQGVSDKDGFIRILGSLSHKSGHVEPYKIDLPVDDKGSAGNPNKTVVQGTGSTFSYGRRYLKLMMFDIAVKGEDDDGNAAGGKVADDTITEEQAKELSDLIGGQKALLDLVVSRYGTEFLADIKKENFGTCKKRIKEYTKAHK